MERTNILERNLGILKNKDPHLAEEVILYPENDSVEFHIGKLGLPTISLKDGSGKRTLLHSSYDPIKEALQLLDRFSFIRPRVWLLLGLGLGYHFFELLKRITSSDIIIVVEKRMDFFKRSLETFDWQDALNNKKIKLIIDQDIGMVIQEIRERYSTEILKVGLGIIRHNPSIDLYPHYYLILEEDRLILRGQEEIRWNIEKVRGYKRLAQKRLKVLSFRLPTTIIRYILQDSIESLRELGHIVKVVELPEFWGSRGGCIKRLSEELKDFRPDFVFSVDHVGLAPHLFSEMKIPYACWFVDNPFFWVTKERLLQSVSEYCSLFLWDRTYIEKLKDLGFEHIHFLPLATNPKVFKKIDLAEEDKEKYRCDLSFVGSSTMDILEEFYAFYQNRIKNKKLQSFIREIIEEQAKDPLKRIEDIIKDAQERLGFPSFEKTSAKDSFALILEFASMATYRKEIIENVKDFDLHLYGDDGWRDLVGDGIDLRGLANYYHDLPKIYNASKINLTMTMAQMKEAINQRVYDVSACGGFVLSDYRSDLEKLFELGKEVVCYRDSGEIKTLCEYFLNHPEERKKIAAYAQKRVLKEHTYKHRMKQVVDTMVKTYGVVRS